MSTVPTWTAPPAPAGRAVVPRPAPPDVRLELGAWCPLDDTLLGLEPTGWSCPACGAAWNHTGEAGWWLSGGTHLPARLAAEDGLQAAGLLRAGHRSTCATCRVWIIPGHVGSDLHTARAGVAAGGRLDIGDEVLADEVDGVLVYDDAARCQLPGDGGGVCGLPRPCPEHALRVTAVRVDRHAARLRRLDRRAAWAVTFGAAVVFGTVAGLAAGPLVDVLDAVAWAAAAGVVGVFAAALGVCELRLWWTGWWPYRHNRLLDTGTEARPDDGQGSDGSR